MRLRCVIANKLPGNELFAQVEADERYFGGHRKSLRGRGGTDKVAVFGLLKRGGKVYTAINPHKSMVYTHQTLTRSYYRT